MKQYDITWFNNMMEECVLNLPEDLKKVTKKEYKKHMIYQNKMYLNKALSLYNNNKTKLAKKLGISRNTITNILNRK